MIKGVHTMFYTSQPEAIRAFFRDKLSFPFTDVGEGWLIFDLPEADQGFHPAEDRDGARTGTPSISFYCDNIETTMAELRQRGVEFTGPVEDHGYGLVTFFKVPGDFAIQLYQPRYVKNPRPSVPPAPTAAKPTAEAAPRAEMKPKPRATKPNRTPPRKTAIKKAVKRVTAKAAPKAKKKAKGRRK